MKKIFVFLNLFCFLFLSCSEDPVAPTDGKIVGYVIDQNSKVALKGVVVYSEPPTETVVTDENGYFYLGNASPGDYRIIATSPEYYMANVSISAKAGKESRAYIHITSKVDGNNPPDSPIITSPVNEAIVYSRSITIEWECEDEDGDKLSYDVYLDVVNPPVKKIAGRINATSFDTPLLLDSSKYYIKIVAYDTYEALSESSVTNFTTQYDPNVPTGEVILHLPLNGTHLDSGPNDLVTYVQNVTYTNDRNGNPMSAAYFDGATSAIAVGSEKVNIGLNYTIMLWCYLESSMGKTNKTDNVMFGVWGAASPGNASYVFYLYNQNTFIFRVCNGTDYSSNVTGTIINKPAWYHVALSSVNGKVTMYLNGVEQSKNLNATAQHSVLQLFIGCSQDGQSFFKGAIDDFYILSKGLTKSEIVKIMEKN
ncbi:MAG: hypothetical protein CVV22_12765 [Ignavibacteriae bacterium HGW-Ignavibacteriae-1]|jgi:hypothetical protein|nr:MAG: hypothetical protein CVV22_12765 [Ignavibacteriae bacterium HGW-Ignavibacteriae-1]